METCGAPSELLLLQCPWLPVNISGCQLLAKSWFGETAYHILLTDMHSVWEEHMDSTAIQMRAQVCWDFAEMWISLGDEWSIHQSIHQSIPPRYKYWATLSFYIISLVLKLLHSPLFTKIFFAHSVLLIWFFVNGPLQGLTRKGIYWLQLLSLSCANPAAASGSWLLVFERDVQ